MKSIRSVEQKLSGYPAPPAQTVVVQQPATVVVGAGVGMLGERPQNIVCPTCKQNVMTQTIYNNGTLTWLLVVVLCLLCFVCAWVPCVVDGCKDVTHQCPNCHNVVGQYKRM